MVRFCPEVESCTELKTLYHKKVSQLVEWYKSTVEHYRLMLATELGMSMMCQELGANNEIRDFLQDLSEDLQFGHGAKMSYFCMADALIKLILSVYSYGPNSEFQKQYQIIAKLDFSVGEKHSWINCKANATVLTEIAAKVLKDNIGTISIDFRALATNRDVRAKLTHAGSSSICLSAMRCYNVIRSMLVFLDNDYDDVLPCFVFDSMFTYDNFISEPSYFSFDNDTTILIADSVHDVRSDYRDIVANLEWDMVVDFDGYSDAGGLQSTVSHNRIQKEVLYRSYAYALTQLPVGKTLWFRCGEYADFSFEPNDELKIPQYIAFHKDRVSSKKNNLTTILKKLLLRAKELERTISIVAVTDNAFIVRTLLSVINDVDVELSDYYISWVGLSDNTDFVYDCYDDEELMNSHFIHYQSPTYQFYEAFAEHKIYWTRRLSFESNFSLPGRNGLVVLSENERNNLENDFELLYDHCEQETSDRSEQLRQEFYKGNMAAWNTIANEYALRLRKQSEYKRIQQSIRTLLGQTQLDMQKRLFFIRHTAGIGGSTFARQIVWDMHLDYAVVSVRNYTRSSFRNSIEHLYDVVLDKAPIIITADDTLPYFKNLCEDVCSLSRRCILIAACRNGNDLLREYPRATFETFSTIQDSFIPLLQERYRHMSLLSQNELRDKDEKFSSDVDAQMMTPFIIGLYYMEAEFSIDRYVSKALNSCSERCYADMLACIAICDRYNRKNVPTNFVQRALQLSMRTDLFRVLPAAESLITRERLNSGIESYHFKHPLLSKRYLDLYCEKYYDGAENLRNALYELSFWLIKKMAAMHSDLYDDYIDILISIIIQNKREGSENQYMSALMLDIAISEKQRLLMKYLADTFRPMADEILNKESTNSSQGCIERMERRDQQILRLVSHAYAHLGRMYSRTANNHTMANESFRTALKYMPDNDPNIYHMAGSALLDKLKSLWLNNTKDTTNSELIQELQQDVKTASDYFDYASDYGSPEYGYPSKLELLCRHLGFLYKIKDVKSVEDMHKLDNETRSIQSDFIRTLEVAKAYQNFDDTANGRIADYENRFQSQIMFGNYSKAVEYYQNIVDRLKSGSDIVGYSNSLRSLVFAQISLARSKAGDKPFYRSIKNPSKFLDDIETLLNQPYDTSRYPSYTLRTQLFRYWMLVAKSLGISIERGLAMASRWLEMESRNKVNKNPEPYYYVKVLQLLSACAGFGHALSDVREVDRQIRHYDSNGQFDIRRGSLSKVRDIFITGKEMAQLFDVSHCYSEEDIYADITEQGQSVAHVYAHFDTTLYQSTAVLKIYDPTSWNGEEVRMDIGKKSQVSFTTAQIGHKLKLVLGFCVSCPIALARYATDISVNDTMSQTSTIVKPKTLRNSAIHAVSSSHSDGIPNTKTNVSFVESLVSNPKNQANDTVSPDNNVTQYRLAIGKIVGILIDSIDAHGAIGHIDQKSSSLRIHIRAKNKRDRDTLMKAYNQKKTIKVLITGCPANGDATGKIANT